MVNEAIYLLKGKFSQEPAEGFDYARSRGRITLKVLTFGVTMKDGKKSNLFTTAYGFDAKAKDFTLTVKIDQHVFGRMLTGTSGAGLRREVAIIKLLIQLQDYCNLSLGLADEEAKEGEKKKEGDAVSKIDWPEDFKAEDRIKDEDLETGGIIGLSHFTDLEQQNKE